jgi:hypothetical protein
VARARHQAQELGAARFEFAVGLAVSAWTPRPQYDVGEAVELRALVRGRDNQPLSGARLEADVEFPYPVMREGVHGRRITETHAKVEFSPVAETAGEYLATWRAPAMGLYRATVAARDDEGRLGSYLVEFVVGTGDPEFHYLPVDKDTLVQLARTTGGAFHTQADAAGILSELEERRKREFRREEINLWNAPWFFVVFLLCLTAEWILRKRRALN